jgi:hypothetical protein
VSHFVRHKQKGEREKEKRLCDGNVLLSLLAQRVLALLRGQLKSTYGATQRVIISRGSQEAK